MHNSDLEAFSELIVGVAEATGGELSGPGIDIYFRALEEFDFEQVQRAATKVVKTWRFTKMPPVAVFLQALGGADGEDVRETARIEAAKVIDLCSDSTGNYRLIDDPVTREVLNMRFGGLAGVGQMPIDKLPFFERDFIELYVACARRGVHEVGREALASPYGRARLAGPVKAKAVAGKVFDALGAGEDAA